MRSSLFHLFLIAGLCPPVSFARERSSHSAAGNHVSGLIYITNVTVIETETGKEVPNRTVIISRGRISEVKDSKKGRPPASAKVVNGSGRYLMPGPWDMHGHAFTFTEGSTGSVTTMPPETYFRLAIANGVTGFREMGGPETSEGLAKLRQAGGDGSSPVPKLFAAGPVLDGPKPTWGHVACICVPLQGAGSRSPAGRKGLEGAGGGHRSHRATRGPAHYQFRID